uniref:G-protein coupled receptors family 1 profile domain-containing protein n=1 Tax=Plectus sambesii TaxID=2011161 RepID=A0A914WM88_9BILA
MAVVDNYTSSEFTNHSLHSEDNSTCVLMSDTLHTRRLVEFGSALIGGLMSTVDLSVLVYLQYKRKGAAIDFLLTISVISILILFFYGISCLPDLCWFGIEYEGALRFWHDYLWMFTVNTLFCAYGYLIVVLIIDRYIAMHHPFYYRATFVHNRMRVRCILACLLIGALCNMKWIILEPYSPDSVARSKTAWFKALNGITCIVQYFVCGLLMMWFSYKNYQKSHEINRDQGCGGTLGVIQTFTDQGQRAHEIVARICVIFTVTYIIAYWPYGIYDYIDNPKLNNDDHFLGALFILINFNQALYLQPNLLIFAYSSRLYRSTLIYILKYPFFTIGKCFNFKKPSRPELRPTHELREPAMIDLFAMLYYSS